MPNSREIKLQARDVLRRRMFPLLLTVLVFLVVQYLVQYMSMELSGLNDWYEEISRRMLRYMEAIQNAVTEADIEAALAAFELPDFAAYMRGAFAQLLSILLNLMLAPLAAGYMFHTLLESRNVATPVRSVFAGFRFTGRVLVITILRGLMVGVGFILFIVPGVVLALKYSLAEYVLFDNPDLGAIACLKESGRVMRGNKWRLFKLRLSFIGWLLAAYFVTATLGLPVVSIWLTPYMYLANGVFYSHLTYDHWGAVYE